MTQSQQMLANLIGSRICHDLISPIGAIHNGIELLILTAQDHSDPEVSLIADSCKTASDLIKFFRITFGQNGEGKSLSALMAQTILEPLLSGERKSLQWNISEDLSHQEVQAIFLSVLCLEAAMPRGGKFVITQKENTFYIEGYSDYIKHGDRAWTLLDSQTEDTQVAPSIVQFLLLPQVAKTIARRVDCSSSSNRIAIDLRPVSSHSRSQDI